MFHLRKEAYSLIFAPKAMVPAYIFFCLASTQELGDGMEVVVVVGGRGREESRGYGNTVQRNISCDRHINGCICSENNTEPKICSSASLHLSEGIATVS